MTGIKTYDYLKTNVLLQGNTFSSVINYTATIYPLANGYE